MTNSYDIFKIGDNFLEICFPFEQDYLKITEQVNDRLRPIDHRIPADCNEQEKVVLEYLLDNNSVKSNHVEKLLNIKDSRSRELLKQMVDKGFVERIGQGRSTYYTLAK